MKILLTTMISLLWSASIYAECALRFQTSESPPSQYQDKSGKWIGWIPEQAEMVAQEAGCQIVYRKIPWGRALLLFQEGEVDMMGGMSMTEERKSFTRFLGPHYFVVIKLLVKEESDYQIQTHEDLRKLPGKLAFRKGGWYGKEIDHLLKDESFLEKVDWITGRSQLPTTGEKIRLGRVSGTPVGEVPGLLNQEIYKGLKLHPFVVHQEPLYFGLSKQSVDPALFEKLQAALERIQARGEFEAILAKYR